MKNKFVISKDTDGRNSLFNRESEGIVIGSLLNNTVEIEEILLHLRALDFYSVVNQEIFSCIVDLYQKGSSIDPIIVHEELEKNSKFSKVFSDFDVNEYIETVSKCTMSGVIIKTHCNIIKDYSLRRTMLDICNDAIRGIFNKSLDLATLIDNVQDKANLLEFSYKNKNLLHGKDVLKNMKNRNFTENGRIKIGFSSLDKIIKGFKKTDFVIIGARPSVGKTSFALNIVNNLCQQNRSVGFFTLEVTDESIMTSLISINAGFEYDKIQDYSFMNENERRIFDKAYSKLENFSFYIENTHSIQIHELKAQARKMKKNFGVEIIFIDYIGLISLENNNIPRYEQVSFLSRNIRALAKELEIPIIVLSQLNREAQGKAPNLANLRESGSLEQDANIIIFLHREDEEQQDNDEEVRKVKVIVAKNRHGATGTVSMDFDSKCTKFVDLKAS